MSNKMIFNNANIVLPDGVYKGSLIVNNGTIEGMLRSEVSLPDYEKIDVCGKTLLPGLIDTHVHMWDPSPLNYREDWFHGSQCAASGGITTIVDMPLSVPPVVDRKGFDLKYEVADTNSFVDFAFWGGLTPSCVDRLEELNNLGCVAYKGFMSFANPDYPQITDGYLVRGMRNAAKFDGLIGVHAENAEVADFGSKDMIACNSEDYSMHDDARPWWVELEAIQRACLFASQTGARLYICHMTITQGAEFLKQQKSSGAKVYVETCPHYLVFDKTALNSKGAYAKCNPPFRSRENVDKLWDYVFDGTIDTLGSDHGPYSDDEKIKNGNFWKEFCGFGGYDAMLSGMLTEGYNKRGLPLEKLAALTSSNAARIMQLDKKGTLMPGSDADIAIVDLNEKWVYDGMNSFSKTKSSKSVYQGMEFTGKVKACYVRGEKVYENGLITGTAGYGKFIPRNRK